MVTNLEAVAVFSKPLEVLNAIEFPNKNLHAMAAEFQRILGESLPVMPTNPSDVIIKRRKQELAESYLNLLKSIEDRDYTQIVECLARMTFSIMATANSYGMSGFIYKAMNEVHKNKMHKAKLKKHRQRMTQEKPDIERIIEEYVNVFSNYQLF